ncbi:tetratricopeptide repeat protein [Burkholderia cepacia]|uniref:tetratricopeptide repeat protein n=1 Tax=Burkholderia cepacia TaxID=292 RepID=UPI0012D91FA4|nr:tetratricopeptide repeat protein [Burkholderia cepacia]
MSAEQNITTQEMSIDRLLSFLSQDPVNLHLLADAAVAAFNAGQYRLCDDLLARHDAACPLPAPLANLRGLSSMSQGRFEEAATEFNALSAKHSDPSLSYNAAYANAMCGSFESAASLDAECLTVVPSAAALKMRALHHLGYLDDALQLGKDYCDRPGASSELKGAYAVVLFDLGDRENAKRYASSSTDTSDSLTIHGLLALEAGDVAHASKFMEEALARNPRESRAVLGLGLCSLVEQRFDEAAITLDDAAQKLSSHTGSWLVAGWAWLLAGNKDKARERFRYAAAADRGFAEAHGALAVVDHLEGLRDDARRHTEIALRLDPTCLSGALAQSIEYENAAQPDAASAIRNFAMNRKLGPDGRTLAQSIRSIALNTHVGSRKIW